MQTYISLRSASGFDWIRLAIYYCQRLVTSRRIRRVATWGVVELLKKRRGPLPEWAQSDCDIAGEWKTQGIVRLPQLLSETQCTEIQAYLSKESLVDRRGTGQRFEIDMVPVGCKLGDYDLSTIVNCPHVMEVANHPRILLFVTRCLGFIPVITGLSMRWSFPGTTPDGVQTFHRDCEVGSLKVLIYITDVDSASGPHTYINASHNERMPLRLKTHSDQEIENKYAARTTIEGPAGTTFAIDAKGLHKGSIPSVKPRLLLTIQYSLLPCFVYRYEPVKHYGSSYLEYYINRLIVKFSSRTS